MMAWLNHRIDRMPQRSDRDPVAPPECLVVSALDVDIAGKPILRNISIQVGRGEVVGLLGRDGAGKTVCFEALAGLTSAASGTIRINSQDVTTPVD